MKITKHLSERSFLFLAILWTVIITVLSLVSLNSIPQVDVPGKDKIVHFLFYSIFVIFWSFSKNKWCSNWNYRLLIVCLAIVYGIIIEVLQSVLTHTREADLNDILANSLGAIVGFVCVYCVKNKFFNKFF
ncbi:VanZ family protein [Flavobacterium sp.]|uniref:VanZ family protein n=1 Tax=Flavobacterium sp. TaxID=239 RepID=UPI003FA5A75A